MHLGARFGLLLLLVAPHAHAAEPAPAPPMTITPSEPAAVAEGQILLLEVIVNGYATGKIVEFTEKRETLTARASDLREVGLIVPDKLAPTPDRPVNLSDLKGISFRIDVPTQRLLITATNASLAPALLTLAGTKQVAPAQSSLGATLNYDVTGTNAGATNTAVGDLDFRLFSPWGVASSTGLVYVGDSPEGLGTNDVVRLDSAYKLSDPETLRRYNVGDFISGSLGWTRSVRLGGLQITSDFSLRPDLVTFPLPSLSGATAVPSTVDVLVNGNRTLSREIGAGPFEVPQVPVVTGANTVSLSVINALGKQEQVTLPFYASATLLAPGLQSYSAQIGAVRNNYGIQSADYGDPAASVTYRRGITDWLTVEGATEGTRGVAQGGAGVAVNLFNLGVLNASAAASQSAGRTGTQFSLGAQRSARVLSLGASATVASRDYMDTAAANGDPVPRLQLSASAAASFSRYGTFGIAYTGIDSDTPARPIDVFIPAGEPVISNGIVVSGTTVLQQAQHAHVLTASYSVQIRNMSISLTATRDFSQGGNSALLASLTIPLGTRSSVSVSGGSGGGSGTGLGTGTGTQSEFASPYGQVQFQQSASAIGDWGASAFASTQVPAQAFAQAQYMAPFALLTGGVARTGTLTSARLEQQGAVSVIDGGVFPSNTVNDSFAIVDTSGTPNIHVQYQNRDAGATDASGRLLVPGLQSYGDNKISILPTDLPPDTTVDATTKEVRPPDRSGVIVSFPMKVSHGALLHLVDRKGAVLPLGSIVTLNSTGATFPVGYDGEAYLVDLQPHDAIDVLLPDRVTHCHADFDYRARPGDIPDIGPLPCQ